MTSPLFKRLSRITLIERPFSYRLVTSLVAPFLPLLVRKRVKAGKDDPERVRERFGRYDINRPSGELIWLHGASVGETQMLRPLIDHLLEVPDRHILITSGTRSSAELITEQWPERVIHQYVPLDTPKATARFLAYWFPSLAIIAESELWPNLIWTTDRASIPLVLINARMSQESLEGWKRRPVLAASVFQAFDAILAADRQTAEGLSKLSNRDVQNIGSLKLDAPALSHDDQALTTLREAIGDRPVWLAASTHEAEEEVFHRLHETLPDAFMIWLPRHPNRGAAIAGRLKAPLRSAGDMPGADNAYVMDTLGEMGLALALSDVCVLGGAFEDTLTGHNPLEAARAKVPLITGPHHASFSDLFEKMAKADAVLISGADDLAAQVRQGLDGELDAMAKRAAMFADENTGALDRTLKVLERWL